MSDDPKQATEAVEKEHYQRWTAEQLAAVAELSNRIGVGRAAGQIGYNEQSIRVALHRHGYRRQWVLVK